MILLPSIAYCLWNNTNETFKKIIVHAPMAWKMAQLSTVQAVVAGTIWPCMVWTIYFLALYRKCWKGKNSGENHWMSQTSDVSRHIFGSRWVLNPVVSPVNPRDLLGSQRVGLNWSNLAHTGQKEWTLKSSLKSESVSCSVMSDSGIPLAVAPLSMEFSRQEYWSGLPFPSPGDLPDPGIEPRSPALQADSLPSESPGSVFQKQLNHVQSCQR